MTQQTHPLSTVLNARLRSVKPKLSIVHDESSVRYECLQIQWFYIFNTFPSMLRHLSPESFNKLLIIFITSQRPLVDLPCQALLFAL